MLFLAYFLLSACSPIPGQAWNESAEQQNKLYRHTDLEEETQPYGGVPGSCIETNNQVCPAWWSYCDKAINSCRCNQMLNDIVKCSSSGQIDGILDCVCITYNPNHTEYAIGQCIFNCMNHQSISWYNYPYSHLSNVSEWTYQFCQSHNRTGILCGTCKNGYYLLAYSFLLHCDRCSERKYQLLKYLATAFLPLSVFCFLILLFNINVHSSQLQGYVLLCQMLATSTLLRLILEVAHNTPSMLKSFKLFGSVYGIWNLDFFRLYGNVGSCLPISTLAVTSLDLLIALYPLLFLSFAYYLVKIYDRNIKILEILWKPFSALRKLLQRQCDIKTSMIDSFSTFLFLSNIKLLNASYDILTPVKVYKLSTLLRTSVSYSYRLYYDSNIRYFGKIHMPYVIACITLLSMFVMLPVLILSIGQFSCFHRCIGALPYSWQVSIYIVIDSFQGIYKNGMKPKERDCRWFSIFPFVIRPIVYVISALTLDVMLFPLIAITFTVFAILVLVVDPFKEEFRSHTSTLTIYILIIACNSVATAGQDMAHQMKETRRVFNIIAAVIHSSPAVYMLAMSIFWLCKNGKKCLLF